MKRFLSFFYFLIGFYFLPQTAKAQLPVCSGPGSGFVYSLSSNGIYNYDPTLTVSSTNPSLNTISGITGGALAVCDNINASGPSPTFYSITDSGATFYYTYYNGSNWVNTGHTIGGGAAAFNIGGGGGFIYNLQGNYIYKYNGTGNATLILTLPSGPNILDIAVDCAGNFYLLNASSSNGWLKEYNSNGSLLNSWTTSGVPPGSGGGGLAIINDKVYCSYTGTSSQLILSGTISGTNISFSSTSSPFSFSPYDFGSCPFGNNIAVANMDTAYYNCNNSAADTLVASGVGPFTWSVLNGPASISGSGDTISVNGGYTNSTIVLSTSAFAPCGNTDTVYVIPFISTPIINSNSPVCTGDTLHLSATGGSGGLRWHWSGPNSFTDTIYDPSINNVSLADSGYYYVSDSLNGCSSVDSIFIHTPQSPLQPQLTSNNPCIGDSIHLSLNNPQAGVSYSWAGPGFSSSAQDTFIANAQSANAGSYSLTAHLNGCNVAAQTNVQVSSLTGSPTIHISVMPSDTFCTGSTVTFTASTSNAGSAPVYQWKKNGSNVGSNSNTYTSGSINAGDVINCKVLSNAACQPTDTAISNSISMHVLASSTPSVNITSQPLVLAPLQTDTFTAHTTNCSNPVYQWYRNGTKIVGGNTNPYVTTLVNGDHISVVVHCGLCASPDSAVSNSLTTVSVNSEQRTVNSLRVWPNPVGSVLHVDANKDVRVSITSIEGKVLLRDCFVPRNDVNGIKINELARGVYFLEVVYDDGGKEVRKVVKE